VDLGEHVLPELRSDEDCGAGVDAQLDQALEFLVGFFSLACLRKASTVQPGRVWVGGISKVPSSE
jgi:hypothetical protein